ncbi:MAG: replication factor C small subunit [Candidatus Aenigmatarchaeota archaeon]
MIEIWAEKYRPIRLSEMINQRHVVERLKVFVKERNVPHMIFAGGPGTGKTTAALCLARELFGENWRSNFLETNASEERGIQTVRGKIKDFARTKPIGSEFKIIFLDECDALTPEAQQALRRTMEQFSSICSFILSANYSSKIIEPIQSRCAVFRFKALGEADIKKFIERIVKGEKLKIDESGINAIIYISEGDLRKVANLLQACATLNEKITEEVVYEVASQAKPDDVKKMIETVLKGNFEESRKILQNMLLRQGLSGSDIIKEIHRQIYSLNIPEETKIRLIERCGEFEFRISEGGNELIQLEALLASFLLFSKKVG